MTARTDGQPEWEVILPSRDRATATSETAAVLAARTLVAENSCGYGASTRVARRLIVTTNGIYDAALTRRVREGQ